MERKQQGSSNRNGQNQNDQNDDGSIVNLSGQESAEEAQLRSSRAYEKNLTTAKDLARQDPKIVANVVKNWVNNE